MTQLPRRAAGRRPGRSLLEALGGGVLAGLWCGVALARGIPGMAVRCRCGWLALRAMVWGGWGARRIVWELLVFPMDSVRYFEFGLLWRWLRGRALGAYLDVSSPRLFTLALLSSRRGLRVEMVNPDEGDLARTEELLACCRLQTRAQLHGQTVERLSFRPGSFDTVVSISVIEHIPDDRQAVTMLWSLLRPGGRLLLTVPCAGEAAEEYLDWNEYGLLAADPAGFVFGQRIYDRQLLEERIWSVTGPPAEMALIGERKPGIFQTNRAAKLSDPKYKYWKEPCFFDADYRPFDDLAQLPGWGVVGMVFVKSAGPDDRT